VNDLLLSLGPSELRAIASGLRSGRLSSPFSSVAIRRFVSDGEADGVATSLCRLATSGSSESAISEMLELLAVAIERRPALEELVDIVTTGPEVAGISNRDTSVVVGDLFRRAERSVVVVGYAVHQGQKLFLDLADRMQVRPELQVRMYLDIKREIGDTSAPEEIVRRFVHRFRTTQWPLEKRLPEIYFDPRALSINERAALHAKCVVVDHREAFVSSANFTDAAQARNIELGLFVHSPKLALRVEAFFEGLVGSYVLNRAI
jgi:phosphatidylserine/phosphatidylglycerophosphate/cardiolipin synthase-like enzyme